MADFDRILPITEVKRQLLDLVKRLQELGGNMAITKNGVPAAVLMSMEEYEGLMETLDIMANPTTMEALARSRRQMEAGELIPAAEVWKE